MLSLKSQDRTVSITVIPFGVVTNPIFTTITLFAIGLGHKEKQRIRVTRPKHHSEYLEKLIHKSVSSRLLLTSPMEESASLLNTSPLFLFFFPSFFLFVRQL